MLVTGAAGFIGTHLVKRLLAENLEVAVVVRNKEKSGNYYPEAKVRHINVDILDFNKLSKAIKSFSPGVVYHLAGIRPMGISWAAVQQAYQTNFNGTMNLLRSLQEVDCQSIVAIGSIAEYGLSSPPYKEQQALQPRTIYGSSKAAASQLAVLAGQLFNMPVTILRPSLVYGPGQGEKMFLSQLIKALSNGRSFSMTEGEQYRDFIFIDDLIECIWLASNTDRASGLIYNVGSGQSITLREAAFIVANIMGKTNLLRIGAIPYPKGEQFAYCVDINRAKQVLGWTPKISFEEGIKRTIYCIKRG